jgi:hypothetical protein
VRRYFLPWPRTDTERSQRLHISTSYPQAITAWKATDFPLAQRHPNRCSPSRKCHAAKT